MSAKDNSLYGIPRPKKHTKDITTSGSLSFTSHLSSLISTSSTPSQASAPARPRPKRDDIFTTHNKNSRKRALADLDPGDKADFTQKHSTSGDTLDDATWKRTKRRMEDKARLYAAMKRGDVEDADERYAVDFDRKWAEHTSNEPNNPSGGSDNDSDDDSEEDEPEELVTYTDEFGRTRHGTRAQAARAERRRNMAAGGGGVADEPDRFTARPQAPANIIYGDTVQAGAFNPEEPVAAQMAELAAKRDREATPPPAVHFDASKEIRTKGTGFFQFSADEEARKKEMANLERERVETERKRAERERRKEERRREVEERRKAIGEKRGKVQADRFLDGLMGEIGGKAEQVDEDRKEGG